MKFLKVFADINSRSELVELENASDSTVAEALSNAVGGFIEAVYMPADAIYFPGCVLYLNEEGKLNNLPFNAKATAVTRGILAEHDVIAGDVIVTGPNDGRGASTSIPDDAVATFRLWEASIKGL